MTWTPGMPDSEARPGLLAPSASIFSFPSSSLHEDSKMARGIPTGQPNLTDFWPDLGPLASHCWGCASKVWPLPRTPALSQEGL